MRLKKIILAFMLALASIASHAVPARKTPVYLRQPDGTVFQARVKGDEFTRIRTDIAGHAIMQGEDGWWYYAVYDADGRRHSTGMRVGTETKSDILAESMIIPYAKLAQIAREKRTLEVEDEGPTVDTEIKEGEVKHGLVILASFKDVKFKHTKEEFQNLLTQEGYSTNGATGSAKEYFDAQFSGKMEFDFHVSDVVTLTKNRSYYGSNDSNGSDKAPAEMIAEACRLADEEIDFSLYDDDGDGKVDNVFVFFAGEDEAEGGSEECIWSHAWYVRSGAGIKLELDGTEIDRYACTSELTIAFDANGHKYEYISGIGTFCHEYSHTLGLPDFYDTDYEENGGIAAGLWISTSLMDGGNYNNMGNTPPYFNALERLIAGIDEPDTLKTTGTYLLEPVNARNRSYIIETENSSIFYLIECRSNEDWDKYIGGSGLLAYRIDISGGGFTKWLRYNEVNVNPEDQKANLLEADGRPDGFSSHEDFSSYRQNLGGVFYPYSDVETLTIDGQERIVAIKKEGGMVRFNYLASGDDVRIPPTAANITKEIFADAAIIGFESSYPHDGQATVAWGRTGMKKDTVAVLPYETGKYAIVLEGLEPAGRTYEMDIFFETDGMESERKTTNFLTKRMPSSSWPFIYLGSMERKSDGTFRKGVKAPLRVYGAEGAAEIRWEFNGKPITHDGDGYYRIQTSGVLQATVYWEDGSVDKIMKQITLSL